MQQVEDQIQQFIEAEQLELAYQLMLSLDKSEPVQAFMDVIGRSLPSNEKIHRLSLNIYASNVVIYDWQERLRIVVQRNPDWNPANSQSIYASVYLQENGETQNHFDELHIYHPEGAQFMLQQIYEKIELNAVKIVNTY